MSHNNECTILSPEEKTIIYLCLEYCKNRYQEFKGSNKDDLLHHAVNEATDEITNIMERFKPSVK